MGTIWPGTNEQAGYTKSIKPHTGEACNATVG